MKPAKSSKRFILHDFLPYLVNRAGVKTGLVFGQDLGGFGITIAEWRILAALWENENLRLNDVADIIVADLSTTSRQVRALERAGLVGRAKSNTDRRALDLVLTASGRELTARIIPIALTYERIATQGLTAADLAGLRRVLTVVFDNLVAFERGCGEGRAAAFQVEALLGVPNGAAQEAAAAHTSTPAKPQARASSRAER